jgi:cell division inhibitor SulA
MHVKAGVKLPSLVSDPPTFELLPVRTQAWVRPPPVSLLAPSLPSLHAERCWATHLEPQADTVRPHVPHAGLPFQP